VTTLVTGGAGYIGAHVVELLRARDDRVIIVDDLSTGLARRSSEGRIEVLDLADQACISPLRAIVESEGVDSVIHFAAKKQVAESVERPLWYHRQNVGGLLNLLSAVEGTGVTSLVYSSSAAVYGEPASTIVREADPTEPINPYGRTKLVGEQLIADAVGPMRIAAASLRYFNVAGALRPELGDTSRSNLVPMVFDRIELGLAPRVFGDDYATPDGTCIRDYVHVADLAEAHVRALDAMGDWPRGLHRVYNVGTGTGSSVREVLEAIERVVGHGLGESIEPRRPGDPVALVADVDRIAEELGWRARFDVDEIVASAWAARRAGSA